MTFPRFAAIQNGHAYECPPLEVLLTWNAASVGYKPPEPVKKGREAAEELMRMFPGGKLSMSR